MIKHLFQRTITRKGKKIKAWYYWFYDENGKQVRKSCGTDGKPCLTKREAEAFIDGVVERKITPAAAAERMLQKQFTGAFQIAHPLGHRTESATGKVYVAGSGYDQRQSADANGSFDFAAFYKNKSAGSRCHDYRKKRAAPFGGQKNSAAKQHRQAQKHPLRYPWRIKFSAAIPRPARRKRPCQTKHAS